MDKFYSFKNNINWHRIYDLNSGSTYDDDDGLPNDKELLAEINNGLDDNIGSAPQKITRERNRGETIVGLGENEEIKGENINDVDDVEGLSDFNKIRNISLGEDKNGKNLTVGNVTLREMMEVTNIYSRGGMKSAMSSLNHLRSPLNENSRLINYFDTKIRESSNSYRNTYLDNVSHLFGLGIDHATRLDALDKRLLFINKTKQIVDSVKGEHLKRKKAIETLRTNMNKGFFERYKDSARNEFHNKGGVYWATEYGLRTGLHKVANKTNAAVVGFAGTVYGLGKAGVTASMVMTNYATLGIGGAVLGAGVGVGRYMYKRAKYYASSELDRSLEDLEPFINALDETQRSTEDEVRDQRRLAQEDYEQSEKVIVDSVESLIEGFRNPELTRLFYEAINLPTRRDREEALRKLILCSGLSESDQGKTCLNLGGLDSSTRRNLESSIPTLASVTTYSYRRALSAGCFNSMRSVNLADRGANQSFFNNLNKLNEGNAKQLLVGHSIFNSKDNGEIKGKYRIKDLVELNGRISAVRVSAEDNGIDENGEEVLITMVKNNIMRINYSRVKAFVDALKKIGVDAKMPKTTEDVSDLFSDQNFNDLRDSAGANDGNFMIGTNYSLNHFIDTDQFSSTGEVVKREAIMYTPLTGNLSLT